MFSFSSVVKYLISSQTRLQRPTRCKRGGGGIQRPHSFESLNRIANPGSKKRRLQIWVSGYDKFGCLQLLVPEKGPIWITFPIKMRDRQGENPGERPPKYQVPEWGPTFNLLIFWFLPKSVIVTK